MPDNLPLFLADGTTKLQLSGSASDYLTDDDGAVLTDDDGEPLLAD